MHDKEIERIKEENERIRQTHVTHEAVEAVIAKTKKDTAREVCIEMFASLQYAMSICEDDLLDIAKKYGIELNEKE